MKGIVMNIKDQKSLDDQTPKWFGMLPLLVASGAFWYAWSQYNYLVHQLQPDWYAWVRPVLMLLLGISCLVAFILFIMNRSSAWSVFIGGLSIIPIMLFTNLIVLIFRVLYNIVQGNTDAFLSRVSTSPLKVILNIIVVVIVLSVIQAIKKRENNDSGHVK
jgi:hypothetical protein